ncbi:hypothetical protein Tco_0860332 [Tanacetum coccineum]|uniref:Uncharacterized protein n=1 Tax=Tanacetum coccineum TaxID=301880 RepID=A0ABQ5BEM9_9ASTR
MANQEQNLPQQEQPFVAAKQVSFNLEDIILNTNNEVALLYPEHTNKEYFKCVSDFISKCCLRKPFTKSPNMYQEYLAEFWYSAKALENSKVSFSIPTGGIYGEVGLNTFRNAIGAHYLPHSSEYVAPPSIDVVRKWFPTIGYGEEVSTKGTLKKSLLPPRWRLLMAQIIQCLGGKTGGFDQITNKDAIMLYSLANGIHIDYANIFWEDIILKLKKKQREKALKPNQPEEPPFTDHTKAICNLDVPVDSKAPKYSSPTEEVPQGKKPGARSGLRRKQSSKHTSESTTEASKSQSGHSKKETKSSSAMDTSPSHPSPPTPVVGEMHKEAQQAAGGPTSLGDTSKDGAHPQLSSGSNPSVLVDKTKYAGDGLKTTHTALSTNEEPGADDISRKVNLEDLSDILKDTRSAFFTPDSPTDEPIIVLDESEEEENAENDKDTKDTSVPPPSLKSAQIQELMAQVHLLQSQKEELEQAKVKAEAEVASMKAKPSYPDINQLTELLVTSLKPELSKLLASHDFASCLPTELKELPSKITGLSREIKELKQHIKDMEIKLPGDLKEIPSKLETFTSTISSLSSQVAELKNIQWELPAEFLDLPHLVSSVQEKLKTLDSLPGLLNKVTNTLTRFATLVENASGDTTTGVPSADKATASPAEGEKDVDTNLKNELVDLLGIDIVTQYYNKKLLYEKYYEKMKKRRQSSKIINYDLAEWRKAVQAYPDRKEKGWKTIYELIKTRMEYLEQTEKELHIDLNKSIQEKDPLDELNDLANKKRKRTGDSTDHSRFFVDLNRGKIVGLVSEPPVFSSLQVLRRLGSIFTSVYAVVQKLNKALGIKQSPLEKVLLKSAEKYIRLLSKDMVHERNYVLKSIEEIKKRLAMSLDSPFGQQATTTSAPPKTRSQSVNVDFIMAPEFKEAQYI